MLAEPKYKYYSLLPAGTVVTATEIGAWVPADFWAFDSMRREPRPRSLQAPTKKPSCDGFLAFLLTAHPLQTADQNFQRT
jgi:hypothetical protein